MEIQGAKGFAAVKYDVTMMGQYILENLAGVDKMQKMSNAEKAAFVKENYPKVMGFFKVHDLQPTLMNLRMNLPSIQSFDLSKVAPVGSVVEPKEKAVSFAGPEEKPVIEKRELMTVCCLLAFMLLLFFILD